MSIKNKYKVIRIKPFETYEWLLKKHYAKRIPSISYAFGLYDSTGMLQGVCTFGIPAISSWKGNFEIIELNRLVVNGGLGKNVLSYFVGKSLNQIDKDYLIVSFADPNNGHNGYIYQATNWIYTGIGNKTINWFLDGKEYHNRHINKSDLQFQNILKQKKITLQKDKTIKELWCECGGEYIEQEGKHRYFFIKTKNKLTKNNITNWLKNKYTFLPYPKGENKRYDANYQPNTQTTLFLED